MTFRVLALSLALLASPLGLGAMQLQPCEAEYGDGARCGQVTVPENRASSSGRTLSLRIVVLAAESAEPGEPLLFFPGGPGQATTDLIPLAQQVYPRVQQTRDLVFIGQRGSGQSNPLHCTRDIAGDPNSAFGGLWDPDLISGCYTEAITHSDPSQYTTSAYVADIAQALDELGYDRVMLWGGSGGTRTAAAFMRAFPDRVIGAALDGVTPIDYAMPAPFSRFVDESWHRVVEDCAAQATCREAFPSLAEDLDVVLSRFTSGPVETEIRGRDGVTHQVPFHRGDFLYAVRGVLYNSQATASLPLEVHRAAETGNLGFFAQALFDRSVGLLSGVVSVGLHLSVYCAEDVPRIASEHLEAAEPTLTGHYLIDEYRGACRNWPVEAMPEEWYRPFETDIPVLLLSGYYDPSTPAEAAERLRRSLPNSKHIVVRNGGHGSGFSCAREAVETFLVSGSLEGIANPCPETPIVFETSSAGQR